MRRYISYFLTLLCCLALAFHNPTKATVLISICLVCVGLWGVFRLIKLKKRKTPYRIPTWDNPAANVLPYYDWSKYRGSSPPPDPLITYFLKKGIPVTESMKVWGKGYGAREIYGVQHTPGKEEMASGTTITSCKEDRSQCLPVPTVAISQKQILTI